MSSGLLVALFFYLQLPSTISVSGAISSFDSIEFDYATPQSTGISPTCGCLSEQAAESWRGIVFTARNLRIRRTSRVPFTLFHITAAFPGPITWRHSPFLFSATVYALRVPFGASFDARQVLARTLPNTYTILSRTEIIAPFLTVVGKEDLLVGLLGDVPVGAWLPADNSSTSIVYTRGLFPTSNPLAVISEEYRAFDAYARTRGGGIVLRQDLSYPLVDFVGPNVVLYSEDDAGAVIGGGRIIVRPHDRVDERRVTVIHIPVPPFAARVAIQEIDSEGLQQYLKYHAVERKVPVMVVPHQIPRGGTAQILIEDPALQAAEHAKVYNRLKKADVTVAKGVWLSIGEGKPPQETVMTFRYPPIPPQQGFHVFGPLSNLLIPRAAGNLVVGSRPIPLGAPSRLDISKINTFSVPRGSVRVPLLTRENRADLEFQATARLSINGEPVNRRLDALGDFGGYFLLLAAAVQSAAALISIILHFRRKSPSRRASRARV